MPEKLFDTFKLFLERYFISTLVAIIPTAIVMYKTPNDFEMLLKLGQKFYLIVVFVIFFLVIRFIIFIYKIIYNKIYIKNQKKSFGERIENKVVDHLLNMVDSLSPQNKKILDYFLENNNKPLIIKGYLMCNQFLDNYCDRNEYIVSDEHTKSLDPINLEKEKFLIKGSKVTRYRLKDEYYNGLKFIKNKYGKISKF